MGPGKIAEIRINCHTYYAQQLQHNFYSCLFVACRAVGLAEADAFAVNPLSASSAVEVFYLGQSQGADCPNTVRNAATGSPLGMNSWAMYPV
jgi:hypothetical protein